MNKADETINERNSRHQEHQQMIEDHKRRKSIARERHHRRWHKTKIIPINLI